MICNAPLLCSMDKFRFIEHLSTLSLWERCQPERADGEGFCNTLRPSQSKIKDFCQLSHRESVLFPNACNCSTNRNLKRKCLRSGEEK